MCSRRIIPLTPIYDRNWQNMTSYRVRHRLRLKISAQTPLELRPNKRCPTLKEQYHFGNFLVSLLMASLRATTAQYPFVSVSTTFPAGRVLTDAPLGWGGGKYYPSPRIFLIAKKQQQILTRKFQELIRH